MGLRGTGSAPSNGPASQHAPEGLSGRDLGDFESAFGDMFAESSTTTPVVKPAQKFVDPDDEEEEELDGEGQPKPAAVEIKPIEKDPLEGIEESQRQARDKWKLQKELRELKEQIAELKKPAAADKDPKANPFKGLKPDDIVAQALAAMEDDGMSTDQAKKAVSNMTPDEIIAKAKEEIRREIQEERSKGEEEASVTQAINGFKQKIKDFSKEKAADYPLIDGLGVHEMVYGLVEKDYADKEREFGAEYAQKNMMTIEQAAKKANEKLASELRSALKSPHMKKFVLELAKEGGNPADDSNQLEDFSQLEDEGSRTLTNSVHRRVTDPKDIRTLSEEEQMAQAFAYLNN